MKKRIVVLLMSVMLLLNLLPENNVRAESGKRVLRVGMEAAYSPFNWTQQDASNDAVPIEDSNTYANGYDVQIARKIADKLGMDLVIVKTEWDGLLPAVLSGKIDVIIAGMSPTDERRQTLDFTKNYYESNLVLVVNANGNYKDAKSLSDFKNAKVVAQLNTFHDTVIDQIPNVDHQVAMADFSAMRVAVQSGKVDAYVAEKPEGVSAERANKAFKMIELKDGFTTNPDDTSIAIGLKKGSELLNPINDILSTISKDEQNAIMD